MSLVVGVDSSTQSTKVEARELDTGRVVARGSAPHPPTEPPVSEQDPSAWWDALVAAMGQLGPHRDGVVAMAVAGQQHGLVMLDEHGTVVRPAKLWNDTTSAPEAEALVDRLGAATWARLCGSVPVASFTITKLAWMTTHDPESVARTSTLLLPHDYLTWRLTGRRVTDRGDASGTGWFAPAENCYRPELLAAALPDPEPWLDRLPTVLPPDAVAGELLATSARSLGLPDGVAVAAGTGDNMAAALGLGLQPGDVALSLGTSGTVYSVSRTPTTDGSGAVAGFADATGHFLPLVCTLNATRVTDTVAAWLGTDATGLSELALQAGTRLDGVVLVPYFDGERTPNLPEASGGLFGLRTTTSRPALARAAHDGVLCGLLDGLDALRSAGVDTHGRLHLIGGGARSRAYCQRGADLYGQAVLVPDADESVATGAALQAASAHSGRTMESLAGDWELGAGELVEPRSGAAGAEVRSAYAARAAAHDRF